MNESKKRKLPCLHERVKGKYGYTCVGCGDTVKEFNGHQYDTSNDF